ncbi:chloramphenicol resistance protein [Xylariomycetidae sp. FL0641]|nr:chloramphenicol resistance protein [Xylariomycetidae sp. FL0641]
MNDPGPSRRTDADNSIDEHCSPPSPTVSAQNIPDTETKSPPPSGNRESRHSDDSDVESQHDFEDGEGTSNQAQDLETVSRVSSGPPYSIFTHRMKWWIVGMNCLSAFISPMTANIYFPAIPAIAESLDQSIGNINLTITTYMVFQALAPTVFGDFGDIAGRRPAFIIAFIIYLGANIGLALQKDYAALLVLRGLQSGGSSGTIALVYAVVADIAPSSERGKYMGIVGAGITIGPALGPVIGGLLSNYLGWQSIFWFLTIVTAAWLVPYILAVPETARKVVGNGSVPPQVWNMTLLDYIRFRRQEKNRPTSTKAKHGRIPIPNPLNTIKVLRHKDMAMVLFYNATLYLGFMTLTATLSGQFGEIYGYNNLQLGLCYLPIGAGTTIASVSNGFVADWNYRRIAAKLGVRLDRKRGQQPAGFPIEKVRIQLAYPLLIVGSGVYVGYGWALERQAHVAVPLVLSFFVGLCVTGPFQIINLLLVDLYGEAPATATAANNLCRCMAGALATALIDRVIAAWGRGWAFTAIAILFSALSPCLWVIVRYGPGWREKRWQMLRQKQEMEAEAEKAAVTANATPVVAKTLPEKSGSVAQSGPMVSGEKSASS